MFLLQHSVPPSTNPNNQKITKHVIQAPVKHHEHKRFARLYIVLYVPALLLDATCSLCAMEVFENTSLLPRKLQRNISDSHLSSCAPFLDTAWVQLHVEDKQKASQSSTASGLDATWPLKSGEMGQHQLTPTDTNETWGTEAF